MAVAQSLGWLRRLCGLRRSAEPADHRSRRQSPPTSAEPAGQSPPAIRSSAEPADHRQSPPDDRRARRPEPAGHPVKRRARRPSVRRRARPPEPAGQSPPARARRPEARRPSVKAQEPAGQSPPAIRSSAEPPAIRSSAEPADHRSRRRAADHRQSRRPEPAGQSPPTIGQGAEPPARARRRYIRRAADRTVKKRHAALSLHNPNNAAHTAQPIHQNRMLQNRHFRHDTRHCCHPTPRALPLRDIEPEFGGIVVTGKDNHRRHSGRQFL